MKKVLYISLLISSSSMAIEPMEYAKKPDITTKSEVVGDMIYFNMGFKDLNGEYQEWIWNDDYRKLSEKSRHFGLPIRDPNDLKFYDSELPSALYQHHPELGVIPDYSALVSFYYDSVTPLYNSWNTYVTKHGLDERQSLELLLRFFQDYPYGVPPDVIDNRLVKGLFVPPLALQNGWADCDSKSLFMATVLAHSSVFKNKVAMILVPGHAFLGIEIRSQVYDEKYEYRNRYFVVAEPTGLSRTPLGRKNSPYSRLIGIVPISSSVSSEPSTGTSAPTLAKELTNKDCPDGGLLLDYFSKLENARIQMCGIRVNGQFVKHGPEVRYNDQGQVISKSIFKNGTKL